MPVKAKAKAPAKSSAKSSKSKTQAKSNTARAKPQPKPQIKPVASPVPDNKAIYLKFIAEVLNGGNFSVAPTYLAPEVKSHNGLPGQDPGVDGFVAALKSFHGAFPDLNVKVTHAVAEGDQVVGRFEVTGTHRGSFLGMGATGRKVHYEEIAIVRMVEGRIAEHWSVADALAILQQLGMSENG
jgi:predicted ester cyclase